jgi:hypothetical protein
VQYQRAPVAATTSSSRLPVAVCTTSARTEVQGADDQPPTQATTVLAPSLRDCGHVPMPRHVAEYALYPRWGDVDGDPSG